MEDLDGKEGFGKGGRERKSEALIPDRTGGSVLVRATGEAAVGVEEDSGVGLECTDPPVDVLEVLGGDKSDVEVERVGSRGGHAGFWRRNRWFRWGGQQS